MPERQRGDRIIEALLKELALPLRKEDIPEDYVRTSLALVALLGATSKTGVEIEDAGHLEFTVKIHNPRAETGAGLEESTSQIRACLIDSTAEYQTEWLLEGVSAPNPKALQLELPPVKIVVFTTDSQDFTGSVWGIRIGPNPSLKVVFAKNQPREVQVGVIDSNTVGASYDLPLVRGFSLLFQDGQATMLAMAHSLEVQDPILQKGNLLFRSLQRLQSFTKGGPPVLLVKERQLARDGLANLANLLGAKFTGEEIDELAARAATSPPEVAIQNIFNRAGRPGEAQSLLTALKEGLRHAEHYGLVARFLVEDGTLIPHGVHNTGRTTHLLPKFKQELQRLEGQEGQGIRQTLEDIADIVLVERANLAAFITSDKIHPSIAE